MSGNERAEMNGKRALSKPNKNHLFSTLPAVRATTLSKPIKKAAFSAFIKFADALKKEKRKTKTKQERIPGRKCKRQKETRKADTNSRNTRNTLNGKIPGP